MLLWEHSDPSSIAGFMVFVGSSSKSFDTVIDVGMATSAGHNRFLYTLDVPSTRTAYVAVAAYSSEGLSSTLSNEQVRPGVPAGVLVPILLYILDD